LRMRFREKASADFSAGGFRRWCRWFDPDSGSIYVCLIGQGVDLHGGRHTIDVEPGAAVLRERRRCAAPSFKCREASLRSRSREGLCVQHQLIIFNSTHQNRTKFHCDESSTGARHRGRVEPCADVLRQRRVHRLGRRPGRDADDDTGLVWSARRNATGVMQPVNSWPAPGRGRDWPRDSRRAAHARH
jgi:hypothetical protein